MTTGALKESLRDRRELLEEGLSALRAEFSYTQWSVQEAREEARLEGRLEEVKVCLRLVESLQIDEEHPLLSLDVKSGKWERVPWGKQERGEWPQSTFGTKQLGDADVLS